MAFDAEWLALREPADHAARNATLLAEAVQAAGPTPRILDLACGTGSTFRAFSAHIGPGAAWQLLDNDQVLLELAGQAEGDIETRCVDIGDPTALPLEDATLVTASALLDLVSAPWLTSLVETLCARRLPFYAALSYDGQMIWDPVHAEDALVVEAFNTHQRGEKGFGPALGPEAVALANKLFSDRGYHVTLARSDWDFPPEASALKDTLTRDIAKAAEEAGYAPTRAWHDVRATRALRVGHLDLLALPPEARSS